MRPESRTVERFAPPIRMRRPAPASAGLGDESSLPSGLRSNTGSATAVLPALPFPLPDFGFPLPDLPFASPVLPLASPDFFALVPRPWTARRACDLPGGRHLRHGEMSVDAGPVPVQRYNGVTVREISDPAEALSIVAIAEARRLAEARHRAPQNRRSGILFACSSRFHSPPVTSWLKSFGQVKRSRPSQRSKP